MGFFPKLTGFWEKLKLHKKDKKIAQVKFIFADNRLRGNTLAYKNASLTYKETRIKTASQGQLIIMLYDEAIRQLGLAIEMLKNKEKDDKFHGKIEHISKAVMKAEEIITELMVSLDFEQGGDISKNLFSLYSWFNKELLEANMSQDAKRMSNVRGMLGELRNTWDEIVKKHADEHANREVVGLNIAG
jgi:flagellar protein FliS